MTFDPTLPRYPSIVHAFWAAVREVPDAPAVACRGRRLTYGELGRAVRALAAALHEQGGGRGRVAIALPSGIEAVAAVLAVLSVGAQAALINPFLTLPELEVVLAEAQPTFVLCGPEARDKLGLLAAKADFGVASFGPGGVLVLDTSERADVPAQTLREPVPEDRALLIFTGGTTGEPRAVEHDHASLFVSLLQHCSVWPVRQAEERFLSVAPIFHIWGLSYATFVPLYCRGTLVILPKYDPDEVLAAIAAEHITIFGGGPPPVYTGLMQSGRYASTDFSSLRYCLSGGAPCPSELHHEWERHTGCPLLDGWGMSEAAPLCLNRPGLRKPLSVGPAVPATEVEVVDLARGQVLERGQAGEVRVRGPQLMLGYRGRHEATHAVLRDGWLYTGDIGYLDADGHLFLVDRKKEMIIVGGYNVYPRQVDEVLLAHPEIAEVATVGRADPSLGEVLVAFVVRKSGSALNDARFFDYCQANLVKYRRPVAVHFVDNLPRTNAHKIDKKALRARLG